MRKSIFIFFCVLTHFSFAQETFPVNGVADKNHNYYAFINAVIHTDYQNTITKGTLLIRDGKVERVGERVKLPKGTVVYDLKGKHIYPSLIDAYSTYGITQYKKEARRGRGNGPQMVSKKPGAYGWNEAIKAEVNATDLFHYNEKEAEAYRKQGFGTVLTAKHDGIVRGSAAVVTLGKGRENDLIVRATAAGLYSFNKGSSKQDYPSSLMGAIALLRQTYLDGDWYAKSKEQYNATLEAFNQLKSLPAIFEVGDKLEVLRADKVGDEYRKQYIIKGAGDEYQRAKEIKETNAKLIIPLNFPDAYDVSDPFDAALVSLEELKHWELAPANAAFLEEEEITFAITTTGLKKKEVFWKNLRKAIEHGLSEKQALKALTYTPAKMLNVSNQVGALNRGMLANFIITSKGLFEEKNIIYENWIQGKPYVINDYNVMDLRGEYELSLDRSDDVRFAVTLTIDGTPAKPKGKIKLPNDSTAKVSITVDRKLITMNFSLGKDAGTTRLSGTIENEAWSGKGQLGNGDWISWSMKATKEHEEPSSAKASDDKTSDDKELGDVIYPFTAYGLPEENKKIIEKIKGRYGAIIIKNATVWTNEKEGILENHDVYITEGKIVRIGQNIVPTKGAFALEIDGTGKHLTAGIIDEHSHIAISRGVNEGTQAISAEVRIGDVVNSEDINIYRQLSGGVVACQLLHGSANPVGGQSALIKLRWGKTPEQMKIEKADGFIKFALGENVKQSNWGDRNTVRFPQTRMGVEQVYYDGFIRAQEYQEQWKRFNKLSSSQQANVKRPRKDLELEALSEILNKKRFISCHSYVQSEINMLMHVADSMGFTVNTFTHILEGYKVADKMKEHGVGGSTFSDWWAYKFEVKDAIPYNAALMHNEGVVTAFNSDDAEMGRRLNQEAAKAVKYGNVSEEDALKFVTLNPAKLLHLDDKMGSIKVGKSGDVVLWSDHPLSIYAKAEKTIIDGEVYFDRDRDLELRAYIQKERARLIEKMIQAKKKGAKTRKVAPKEEHLYHCETLEDYQ